MAAKPQGLLGLCLKGMALPLIMAAQPQDFSKLREG